MWKIRKRDNENVPLVRGLRTEVNDDMGKIGRSRLSSVYDVKSSSSKWLLDFPGAMLSS